MSDKHVKVFFELEQDEDGYPPATVESLWAIEVGEGRYKLDNIPFFATGVAVEDIVSARHEEGALWYQQLLQPSGHSTLRIIVYDASEVPQVRDLLHQLGCATEASHVPGLIAVDVPPSVPLRTLKPMLDSGRAQERWDYEEGCLGQD